MQIRLYLFTTVIIPCFSWSQNIMRIDDVVGSIGSQVEVVVSIENGEPFTAFQLDITFPDVLTVHIDTAALGLRKTDHTLSTALVVDNTYRVLAYSPNNEVFIGNEGPVVTIFCDVSPPEGEYSIEISEPIIGDQNSNNILSSFENGTLTVIPPGILGDVNGDGAANSTDALIVLSCDVGFDTQQFCPMNCGDVNYDDLTNSSDALLILSKDVGFSVPFPIGNPGCPTSVTNCPGCVQFTD